MLPGVSIVIPAYNARETITQTLESVIAQTHPNWEAIVVDDGSVDATADIVKTFVERDSRIRLLQQTQTGEAGARNAGLSHVRYDWLLFLDADDWISPLHLETMLKEVVLDPELSAVHCGSARVAADGTMVVESYLPPAGDLFTTLARRAAFPVNACIVRKSVVESVGMFDTSLVKSPDWDLWQRIARTGARFGSVREVLAYYRMRSNAASLDAHQMLKDGLRVLKQGHAPDPRVPNPHPDHADGLPADQLLTQQYYLLSWCAGLLLGTGKDARPLMKMVNDTPFPELYPESVAQCIFESAPLPLCQSPYVSEELFFRILRNIDQFLVLLEQKSLAPDFAHAAGTALRRMILKNSPNWKNFIEEYERNIQRLNEKEEQLGDSRREFERIILERDASMQRLQQDIRSKEKQNAQLQEDIASQERQNRQLEEDMRGKNLMVAELDAKVAALEERRESLQKEIEVLQNERDKAWGFVRLWKSRYKQLRMNLLVRVGLKLRMMKNPMSGKRQEDKGAGNN
ncbi:glycosyltransferase [bacterium]|nr:glycosyltransferase [bacterium]